MGSALLKENKDLNSFLFHSLMLVAIVTGLCSRKSLKSSETNSLIADDEEGSKIVSLSEMGRHAGTFEGFEAWLLKGQTYNQIFYNEFWGLNKHRLDKACLVSEHSQAGICLGTESEKAYFMHSSLGNPRL